MKKACDGDPALLEEVESLLRYESDAARFLETPAAVVASDLARSSDKSQMIGRQLGPYTIVAPLGAGGMGEVYRARDSKLGRDVAIKILPSHFTADRERRARFAREARLLATLNHPHIGAIYGLEETDGVTALVLELVDGPTLADRLARGPLTIADALTIARQIAEALDAAHEKGIVHRDLKPANIVMHGAASVSDPLSGDARAKVLDFGLAKTIVPGLDGDLAQRPAGSLDGTAEGRILGTPAYMSPEQARGHVVDKRSDIWSFGCILYEMLSGRRAFDGDTISDTFVSILEHEPDWTALPAATPASIRTLLERCLRKDPRARLHDIADARIELDEGGTPIAATPSADIAPGLLRGRRAWLASIGVAALVLAFAATMLVKNRDSSPAKPDLVQLSILAPDGFRFGRRVVEFAVSPDGQHIAFVATSKAGSSLWVRSLASVDPRALAGTEGARNPFWSPDGQSIGFFANNQLKTVQASGGSSVVAYPGTESLPSTETGGFAPAGSWSSKDVIVFGPSSDGELYQINVKKAGAPTPVTKGGTYTAYQWPSFLSDGQHFIYSRFVGTAYELRAGSLATMDTVVIGTFNSYGVYAPGRIFFARGRNLMVQSFNEETLTLVGDPVELAAQIRRDAAPAFSVSASGRLVFLPPPTKEPQLTWLNRGGQPLGTVGDPGRLGNLDLSPDDGRLAVSKVTSQSPFFRQSNIWVIDLATGKSTLLTDAPPGAYDAAWSPDGNQIVFDTYGRGRGLFTRHSDGSGADVPLVTSETDRFTVATWSPTGVIMFNAFSENRPSDLWTLSMSGDRRPKVFLSSKYSELNAAFSRDGRWVAYQSDASGRYEVFVRPFPDKDPAQTISRDGGMYPRWRSDGRELFFVSPDGTMMAAGFDPKVGQPQGVPQRLFPTQIFLGDNRPYAVDRNGERFLLPVGEEPRVVAVMDWRALLNR